MGEFTDKLKALRAPTKDLRDYIPEAWAGFSALHAEAVADGVIPARLKEAAAVAIAVANGCEGCIAYHARAAARNGATDEEMAEMLAVALLMAGGPASVNAPRAWAAFQEFKAARPRPVPAASA